MTANTLITIILALGLIVYLIVRQMMPQPVTQRTVMLPAIATAVCAVLWAKNDPSLAALVAVMASAVGGLVMGAFAGSLRQVWRDANGAVMMRGDWRYLATILALLGVRIAMHFVLGAIAGTMLTATDLNNALIAMLLTSYLASSGIALLRALPLVGGAFAALPQR